MGSGLPSKPTVFSFAPYDGKPLPRISGQFTLCPGPAPSQAEFQVAAESLDDLEGMTGILTLSDGVNPTFRFNDCYVRRFQVARDYSPDTPTISASLAILDRRWRWMGMPVHTYTYNYRDAKGNVLETGYTGRTAKEIAVILLDLMKEKNYTIEGLPEFAGDAASYPFLECDHELPAACLHRLCEICGCVLTLGADDRVHIYQVGTLKSASIPPTAKARMRVEDKIDHDPIPEEIEIRGAPMRFELEIPLHGVVKTLLGKVVSRGITYDENNVAHSTVDWLQPGEPITFDTVDRLKRSQLDAEISASYFAEETLLKWYALQDTLDKIDAIPGPLPPRSVYARWIKPQLLDLEESDGSYRPRKAQILGEHQTRKVIVEPAEGETEDGDEVAITRVDRKDKKSVEPAWVYDDQAGIVKFKEQVFRQIQGIAGTGYVSSTRLADAEIILHCTLEVPYAVTSYVRKTNLAGAIKGYRLTVVRKDFRYDYPLTGAREPTQEVAQTPIVWNGSMWVTGGGGAEIYRIVRPRKVHAKTPQNQKEMDALAKSYFDEELAKIKAKVTPTVEPATETYPGLLKFSLDGMILQITWASSAEGDHPIPATTVVSYGTEHQASTSPSLEAMQMRTAWAWKAQRAQVERQILKMDRETLKSEVT